MVLSIFCACANPKDKQSQRSGSAFITETTSENSEEKQLGFLENLESRYDRKLWIGMTA